MVHLAGVASDKEIEEGGVSSISNVEFPSLDENTITTSVYGSRWAGQDLPKNEMPDDEMPKEVAYRMIKCVLILMFEENKVDFEIARDDLTLDGTPTLNLASFVTTCTCRSTASAGMPHICTSFISNLHVILYRSGISTD